MRMPGGCGGGRGGGGSAFAVIRGVTGRVVLLAHYCRVRLYWCHQPWGEWMQGPTPGWEEAPRMADHPEASRVGAGDDEGKGRPDV